MGQKQIAAYIETRRDFFGAPPEKRQLRERETFPRRPPAFPKIGVPGTLPSAFWERSGTLICGAAKCA